MRGKLPFGDVREKRARIIPAHAGQTYYGAQWYPPWPDHPRACGANQRTDTSVSPKSGSSPRMRGKHIGDAGQEPIERIIPAHAGQTCVRACRCRGTADHPRACGANRGVIHCFCGLLGSSPRMRGKPADKPHAVGQQRIIPAHAGQTARFIPIAA